MTRLHNFRVGRHRTFTRLVFDMHGAQPSRISLVSDHVLVIACEQLQTRVCPVQLLWYLRRYISKVRFEKRPNRSLIKILLRSHTVIRYFFLHYTPPRSGWYRLVVDFAHQPFPPSRRLQKTTPNTANRHSQVKKRSPQPPKVQPPAPPASSAPVPPAPTSPAAASSTAAQPSDHLYQIANRVFLKYQHDILQHAVSIIEAYQTALAKGPQNPRAALAHYRCALAYAALGDPTRAKHAWQKVIHNYPHAACVDLCWLQIGHMDRKDKNYLEAILAFQNALAANPDATTAVALHYELGMCLEAVGQHQQAIANFQQCLSKNPTYYLQKPDLLRSMGVAWFALHQYAKSNAFLFRYLNLEDRNPDRDLVLARIADSLQHLDHPALAGKLYAYVERHFPKSQGYIISEIRKAASLAQKHGKGSGKVYAIYRELAQLPLSDPLRKLVLFKLAYWQYEHHNYPKSLALIHEMLRGQVNLAPYEGFQRLEEQVVTAWTKQAMDGKNYLRVIQLYEQHHDLFQGQDATFMALCAAKSYAKLQIYSRALAVYEELLAGDVSSNPHYLLKAAHYAFLVNDLKTAEHYCTQIPAHTLPDKRALLLGQILFAEKNYQKAAQQFSQLLNAKAGPASFPADARMQYAESLLKLAKPQTALACLQQTGQQLGSSAIQQRVHLYLLQARCYQSLKQFNKAIDTVQQALTLAGSKDLKDQLNYKLASLYIATKQMQKATARLSALVQKGGPFWKTAAQQELTYLKL